MRCGRSSSRASPTADRSLCATYHILEGAYKPESENRPKSTIVNKPFTGGQDAHQEHLLFVEQAVGPFKRE